jgi:hypothetical protein
VFVYWPQFLTQNLEAVCTSRTLRMSARLHPILFMVAAVITSDLVSCRKCFFNTHYLNRCFPQIRNTNEYRGFWSQINNFNDMNVYFKSCIRWCVLFSNKWFLKARECFFDKDAHAVHVCVCINAIEINIGTFP